VKLEHINMGTLWTMITGTVIAVLYMFTTFASASDLVDLRKDIWYDQYYDTRDRIGNTTDPDYLQELRDRLEKLKAQICEEDPEWRPCKENE